MNIIVSIVNIGLYLKQFYTLIIEAQFSNYFSSKSAIIIKSFRVCDSFILFHFQNEI